MDPNWNDSQPIYRQLRDRVVAMILEGVLKEGDPLPSVRNVAAEYQLNPLTVLKGYQQLVDEQLVEKKRGRGMFVSDGARRALLKDERQKFLEDEWPKVRATIARLGLNHPLGPLALADLIGLDTCVSIMEVLHDGLGDPKYAPCPLLRQFVAAGRLGRKTGRGFHEYGHGS